jgi:DNA-binding YbaB/EbfC family protein
MEIAVKKVDVACAQNQGGANYSTKEFSMNIMEMMKQASQLKEKLAEMQAQVEAITETGVSGGGMVSVTLNGKGAMKEVKIDPSLLKEGEGEILEDLIAAAHADAKTRIDETLQSKMQELTGGLPLPPGLNMF